MIKPDKPKDEMYETDIILVDIISFSQLSSTQQLDLINYLTKSYTKMISTMLKNSAMTMSKLFLGFISTGDGFYCILHPDFRGFGPILALGFNHFSDTIAQRFSYFRGVRIAVHSGKVYPFTDIMGNTNFVGDGLNDCARFVESKEYKISTVTVSKEAFTDFENFIRRHPDFEALLNERQFRQGGAYTFYDKHGTPKTGYVVWLRKGGIIYPPYKAFKTIISTNRPRKLHAFYN